MARLRGRAEPALLYAGSTDTGRVRPHNEDAFLVSPTVLAVADGMGGHAAGEVASRIAVDTLARVMRKPGKKTADEALTAAIREANQVILERAGEYERFSGMGTTVTAASIITRELTIAHVGDSRAYILRDGRLTQLTEDHSLVHELMREGRLTPEEAANHPQRSVITRALGTEPELEVDILEDLLHPGDVLLLTTDGLTSVVTDEAIQRTLADDAAPAELCSRLIAQANVRGGPDNITVVVARYVGDDTHARPKKRRVWPRLLGVSLAFLLALAVAAGAAYGYLSNNYYLAFSQDRVALHRGLPGAVLGLRLSRVYRVTNIHRDELPGFYQERLTEGIPLTGAEDADRVISEIVLTRQPARP